MCHTTIWCVLFSFFFFSRLFRIFILFVAGLAVGIPVNEFNEIKDLEMMTFRRNMLQVCKDVTEERDNQGPFNQAMYVYPPDVENSPDLPVHLQQKVNEGKHGKGNVSLAPGRFLWNFRHVIFKLRLTIDGWGIPCEIALIWLDVTEDQSTLVQVMAWYRQATTWANVDPDLCRHIVALGHNELTLSMLNFSEEI